MRVVLVRHATTMLGLAHAARPLPHVHIHRCISSLLLPPPPPSLGDDMYLVVTTRREGDEPPSVNGPQQVSTAAFEHLVNNPTWGEGQVDAVDTVGSTSKPTAARAALPSAFGAMFNGLLHAPHPCSAVAQ